MPEVEEALIKERLAKMARIEKRFERAMPSKERSVYWIYAKRKKGNYPAHTERGGKWLVFVDEPYIDAVWKKIKKATADGRLGGYTKVSTAKPLSEEMAKRTGMADKHVRVVCVYTYDYQDKVDSMRIREELRKMGIIKKIPYKPDYAAGKYGVETVVEYEA
ncbi:MAG: DUF1917 domain-containing protein [Candidatus Diapherotrites archaeon]|nr:DUF1917 domain-containing protein [Candidatus Diapherotrites archaeon]